MRAAVFNEKISRLNGVNVACEMGARRFRPIFPHRPRYRNSLGTRGAWGPTFPARTWVAAWVEPAIRPKCLMILIMRRKMVPTRSARASLDVRLAQRQSRADAAGPPSRRWFGAQRRARSTPYRDLFASIVTPFVGSHGVRWHARQCRCCGSYRTASFDDATRLAEPIVKRSEGVVGAATCSVSQLHPQHIPNPYAVAGLATARSRRRSHVRRDMPSASHGCALVRLLAR